MKFSIASIDVNEHFSHLFGRKVRISDRYGSNGCASEKRIIGATGILVATPESEKFSGANDIFWIILDDSKLALDIENWDESRPRGFLTCFTKIEACENNHPDDCPKCKNIRCKWNQATLMCPNCKTILAG